MVQSLAPLCLAKIPMAYCSILMSTTGQKLTCNIAGHRTTNVDKATNWIVVNLVIVIW